MAEPAKTTVNKTKSKPAAGPKAKKATEPKAKKVTKKGTAAPPPPASAPAPSLGPGPAPPPARAPGPGTRVSTPSGQENSRVPPPVNAPANPNRLTDDRRSRKATQRAKDAANQTLQKQVTRIAAKEKQARRQEARAQNEQFAAAVEQEGDSEEMRELRRTWISLRLKSPPYFFQRGCFRPRLNWKNCNVKSALL